jgi:hypothetical protein
MPQMSRIAVALAVTAGVMCSVGVGGSADAASSRRCGTVSTHRDKTLRVTATAMSCSTAKRFLRSGLDSQGRVKVAHAWTISAGGCEGVLRRSRDADLTSRMPHARYVVVRGCDS